MDQKLLVTIYYCLVFSHLSYGIQAWGSACQTHLSTLKVIQNKAVRIICGKQYFQIYGQTPGPLPSSNPLYKELEILKLDDIFNALVNLFSKPSVATALKFSLIGSPIHIWYINTPPPRAHSLYVKTFLM